MIKLIKKILGICDHNWKTEESIDFYWNSKYYCHTVKHCRCTKCGTWKKFEV